MAASRFTVDWPIAEQVFGRLLDLLRAGEAPYDKARQPHIPENLPANIASDQDLACFLFCVCYYMKGGINSWQALLALTPIHEAHPEIFQPSYFGQDAKLLTEQQALVKTLLNGTLNYGAIETSEFWAKNFQKLNRFWQGNPLELFKDTSGDYRILYDRIINRSGFKAHKPDGFLGFQEKMASMLAYFYVDTGLAEPLMIPVPVDFHVMRMIVEHGIIRIGPEDIGQNLRRIDFLKALRDISIEYCSRHRIEPVELCDALWLYSRSRCKDSPGNTGQVGQYAARQTPIIYQEPAKWSQGKVRRYYNVCASCPISDTCVLDVPSAHYYRRGELICLPKKRPLQTNLFY